MPKFARPFNPQELTSIDPKFHHDLKKNVPNVSMYINSFYIIFIFKVVIGLMQLSERQVLHWIITLVHINFDILDDYDWSILWCVFSVKYNKKNGCFFRWVRQDTTQA